MDEISPFNSGGPRCATPDGINGLRVEDQAAIRNAIRKWPKRFEAINEERKRKWIEGLDEASRIAWALGVTDPKAAADIHVSVAKTGVSMEKLNQEDEHLKDKNDRLDEGKATEMIAIVREP
jgi:uncharacterized protein (DUF2461 family)